MNNGEVTKRLSAILTEIADIPPHDIEPDKTLEELGVDSVAAVELGDVIKEQFGVGIEEEELIVKETPGFPLTTVAALATKIHEKSGVS